MIVAVLSALWLSGTAVVGIVCWACGRRHERAWPKAPRDGLAALGRVYALDERRHITGPPRVLP